MADKIIRCSECEYCKGYNSGYATRKRFYCKHENQQYISDYFETHKIFKETGFIAFSTVYGCKPTIKTSPAWCPKKADSEV